MCPIMLSVVAQHPAVDTLVAGKGPYQTRIALMVDVLLEPAESLPLAFVWRMAFAPLCGVCPSVLHNVHLKDSLPVRTLRAGSRAKQQGRSGHRQRQSNAGAGNALATFATAD